MITNDFGKTAIGKTALNVKKTPEPLILARAPLTTDLTNLMRTYLNTATGKAYVLTKVSAGAATWTQIGAADGSGTFTDLTATGTIALTSDADVTISSTTTTEINTTTTLDLDAGGNVSINSSAGDINIGDDAVAQTLNLNTGAAAKLTVLGSDNTTSGTTIEAGTSGLTMTSTGVADLDAAGDISLNSSGGNINIGDDAVAQTLNLNTGVAAKITILGSTDTTSGTLIQAGTTGLDFDAGGIVTMTPATDSQAGAACTVNANVGVCTFTGLTTAANTVETLTITNSVCTATSAILCTVSNMSTTAAKVAVHNVKPGVGSFVVDVINTNGAAAAVDGDLILTFWIVQ